MVHRTVHGALCWSIDSKSAIFYIRKFKWSMEIRNWENCYSKLYSRQHNCTSCIEETGISFCNDKRTFRHTPKIGTESWQIFVANFLSGLLTYQTQNLNKLTRQQLLLPHLNAPVLSTVFDIARWYSQCCGPTVANLHHIHTHTYKHTYTHTHTYIHTNTYINKHMHTHIHTYTHMHTYIHTHTHNYIHAHIRGLLENYPTFFYANTWWIII